VGGGVDAVSPEPNAVGPRPAILVRDVMLTYPRGGVTALDGVSLRIEPGEAVGIMGQNGSGKTSLAKLFNGLLRPTRGSVQVDGRDTAGRTVQQLAATVGYVFQNPNHQLFASTVTAELAFGPANLGLDRDEVERRVAGALERFDLGAHASSHPYRLSFPLRKLVAIASVVTMHPAILVLDEPTTGQDHRTTTVINRLIHGLREQGCTVICVSHDMPLLADVAERLVVLREGRIIADGPPREVFADADAMRGSHLAPPQVTQISIGLARLSGRPPALGVPELAATLRATATATATGDA
jgi:energy-coupling factor transport system ATP-binding protein